MIPYQEALHITDSQIIEGRRSLTPVHRALGMVIADSIKAPVDLPPFRQSAMDGYAIIHGPFDTFEVIHEIKAGDEATIDLKPGQAVQIFTGAMLPQQADTIVIQEHVQREGNLIKLTQSPTPHRYIRPKAEQFRAGEEVFEAGTVLNEAAIGLIASLGITEVWTYRPPSVGVILTGNELVPPGKALQPGQIYESNGLMLKAALAQARVDGIDMTHILDHPSATLETIREMLTRVDILIISGGISVGKYDVVQAALANAGVEKLFYQVAQKPGKPLWFGKKGQTYVFALPGNPASSLTCFLLYVLPFIRRYRHLPHPHLPRFTAPLGTDASNQRPRVLFAKGQIRNQQVNILRGQSSAMLHTYAQADSLIIIPPHTSHLPAGSTVEYIDLQDRFRG